VVTEPATASPAALPASASESAALLEPIPPPPLLKLRFSGASWAEVKDAEGKVLHSQHNTAGAEYVIEGTPPFYVVIGDTTKTSVEVRGEAYDLSQYSRQNVARFTIN
jgi:cytoskeleton protein RodZ